MKNFTDLPTEEFSHSKLQKLYDECLETESSDSTDPLISLILKAKKLSKKEKNAAIRKLTSLTDNSEPVLTECEKYVGSYFYRAKGNNYLFYDSSRKQFDIMDRKTLIETYLNFFPVRKQGKAELNEMKKWFLSVNDSNNGLYRVQCDPNLPFIKNGVLNTFTGSGHPLKDYKKYDEKTKEGVETWLTFIKEVICANDATNYEFMLNYLACICQYKQTGVIMYLKAIEGTGKSTFCDFIYKYLLRNDQLVLKAPKELLTNGYTMSLMGKSIAYFEELPSHSKSQAENVKTTLNDLATSPERTYNEKYVKSVNNVKNFVNIMITTNFDTLNDNGRRFYRCDVSTHREQDHKYFKNLKEVCYNFQVGEALFNLLRVRDVSKFHGQDKKWYTQNKIDFIHKKLGPLYVFLKHEYILSKKSVAKVKKFGFYKEFKQWMEFYNSHDFVDEMRFVPDRKVFYKQLEELGIQSYASGGNNWFKNINYKDLEKKFNLKKWIHADDYDIHNELYVKEDNKVGNKIYTDAGMIRNLKEGNEGLQSKVDNLKRELKDLKKKLKLVETERNNLYRGKPAHSKELFAGIAAAVNREIVEEGTTSEDSDAEQECKKKKTKVFRKKTKSKKAKKNKTNYLDDVSISFN